MFLRTVLFAIVCSVIWVGQTVYDSSIQPEVSSSLTVKSVNGGDSDAANLRMAHHVNNQIPTVAWLLTAGAFVVCYGGPIKRGIVAAKENVNA
jgi:hypothetical protein